MKTLQNNIMWITFSILLAIFLPSASAAELPRGPRPVGYILASDRTNEAQLVHIIQEGTNVDKEVFFAAVEILAERRCTNAIGLLTKMIDYRRTPERDPKTGLGPVETLEQAWPVAYALVEIGWPSLDALVDIIERSEDRKKVAIAAIAMTQILGNEAKRNTYFQQRIEKTKDKEVIRRLERYIVPERSPTQ